MCDTHRESQDPIVFYVPCPHCGEAVPFPFDPVRSALLDHLEVLRQDLSALQAALKEVA
jgi:phage terminase large subunit GpA-like protein